MRAQIFTDTQAWKTNCGAQAAVIPGVAIIPLPGMFHYLDMEGCVVEGNSYH